MSQDLINQITLNCLMNKHQYEKYVTNKISKSINEEDKKYYMERILSLTKEVITNSESEYGENIIAPDVKYTFEQYIKSCIQYFKLTDNNYLIQEKYKELDINVIEELKQEKDELVKEEHKEQLKEEQLKEEKDNSLWIRSIKICNPSLDSFITMNSTKKHND